MVEMPPDPGKPTKRPRGSGIPAGGQLYGGESWGGPAKGPGTGGPAKAATGRGSIPKKPRMTIDEAMKRSREENAMRMKAVWLSIAEAEDAADMARLVAAEKYMNREFGAPEQTVNVNDLAGLTDEQLRRRLEQARRRAGDTDPGGADPPKEPQAPV